MALGEIQVYPELKALSEAAAEQFIMIASNAVKRRGSFSVALTGGSTVRSLYQVLANPPSRDQLDWNKGLFYWGDERLVPPDHPESNYGQAYHLLLSHLDVKPERIFRIQGELPSSEAIEDYQGQLKKHADKRLDWPRFDLVLLSLGLDGHIASLFPGKITDEERNSPVIATSAEIEGQPVERVSLTPMVFNSARNIFFMVVGEKKSDAFRWVLLREKNLAQLPALRIQPRRGKIIWFVNEDAAGFFSSHSERSEESLS